VPPPLKRMPSGNRCKGRGYMLQGQHPRRRGLTAPLDSPFQGVFTPLKTSTKGVASGLAPGGRAALAPCPTVSRLDTPQSRRSGLAFGKQGRKSHHIRPHRGASWWLDRRPVLVLHRIFRRAGVFYAAKCPKNGGRHAGRILRRLVTALESKLPQLPLPNSFWDGRQEQMVFEFNTKWLPRLKLKRSGGLSPNLGEKATPCMRRNFTFLKSLGRENQLGGLKFCCA